MDKYENLINNSQFFKNFIPRENKIKSVLPIVKLNLACGPNIFPFNGWINIDRVDLTSYFDYIKRAPFDGMPPEQQIVSAYLKNGGDNNFQIRDLDQGIPQFANDSVDLVYLGQCIEHESRFCGAPKLIKECYRIMKTGSVLRITTPDLNKLIDSYLNNQMDRFSQDQPEIYKSMDQSGKFSMLAWGASGQDTFNNYSGHMFLYTQTSLTQLLNECGFTKIHFYDKCGESQSEVMARESKDYGVSHSILCEAVK